MFICRKQGAEWSLGEGLLIGDRILLLGLNGFESMILKIIVCHEIHVYVVIMMIIIF